LGLFLGAIAYALATLRRGGQEAVVFLVISISGFFVALDAWDGVGSFWMFTFGVVVGSMPMVRDRIVDRIDGVSSEARVLAVVGKV
jgi:hypothetical protein